MLPGDVSEGLVGVSDDSEGLNGDLEQATGDDLINLDSDSDIIPGDGDLIGLDVDIDAPSGNYFDVGGGSEDEPGEDGISVWSGGESSDEDTTVLQFEDAIDTQPDTEIYPDDSAMIHEEPTVDLTDLSTADSFVTPAQSPSNMSPVDTSDDEASDNENQVVQTARRSKRLRRGRNYLTYPKLGEPKISRYTMMAIEHGPQ